MGWDFVSVLEGPYWAALREPMLIWTDLFDSTKSHVDSTSREDLHSDSKNFSLETTFVP